jgi:hypothetical protein
MVINMTQEKWSYCHPARALPEDGIVDTLFKSTYNFFVFYPG